MLSQERQKRIYERIKRYNSATVIDLSTQLQISLSTVRRDLSEMEAQGLVLRVHGGAILFEDNRESPGLQRRDQNLEAKKRIGAAAAQLVHEGDTIILSASTTVETMIPHLVQKHSLTVITNSVSIAYKLAAHPHISVIVLGGWLRYSEFSLLGQITQNSLTDLIASKIFHSAYGLDPDYGLTGMTLQEVETDRALIKAAPQLIVAADSSKFSQIGTIRLVPTARIHTLITDSGAKQADLEKFEQQSVRVIAV